MLLAQLHNESIMRNMTFTTNAYRVRLMCVGEEKEAAECLLRDVLSRLYVCKCLCCGGSWGLGLCDERRMYFMFMSCVIMLVMTKLYVHTFCFRSVCFVS